jgi:pimeloyl-ACP methyl ester carboxylesterase
MEQGNQVLWFDRAGALTYKSYLVEADRPEDFAEWMGRLVAKQTVTFRHGSDTLVGDLRLPAGPAPYPAIVFVHGAGLPSRHSPYYRPLAEEFFRRGFATLVWSRPGVDESTGDYLDHSMDQRAGEVEAAIRYLGERADIAPTRIGLWATSQAGFVVPKVAARREVAFANLVSCSAQGVIDQTLYATENVLALLGMSEVERDEALDNLRSEYELIRVSGTHEEFLRGQEQLLAEATQRSWYAKLAHSPAAPEAWFLGLELPWYLRFLPRTSASYPPTARAFRSFIRSSGTTLLLESSASEHRCS